MAKTEALSAPNSSGAAQTEPDAPAAVKWIQRNQKPLLYAVIALVLVAGGTYLTLVTQQRKEFAAQQALSNSRAAFDAYDLPSAAAGYQDVIDRFGGTAAAEAAEVELNSIRVINGQTELAVVALRDFLDRGPSSTHAAPAAGLLASALENLNRYDEAGEAFLKAADLARDDYLTTRYLLDAGRALSAAGDTEGAKGAYLRIIEDYPESPSITEAKLRYSELAPGELSDRS